MIARQFRVLEAAGLSPATSTIFSGFNRKIAARISLAAIFKKGTFVMDSKRNITIDDIDYSIRNTPIFYLKFTSKKSYANDILDGNLYANTAKWFRDKELTSGEHGQGDKNELLYSMPLFSIQFTNPETGDLEFEIPQARGRISFDSDDNIPIVCFVGIPLNEMNILHSTPNDLVFSLPFSETEFLEISKIFGEYCVLIEAKALTEAIEKYCKENSCRYNLKNITYCASNYIDKAQAFAKGDIDRFFFKDEDYAYQREYRLIFDRNIPEDHYIRIGSLKEHAVILNSSELSKLHLVLHLKTNC